MGVKKMKNKILLIIIPSLLFSKSINFQEALNLTLANNKELKAKTLNIKQSKINLLIRKGYDFGNLIFNENVSNSNHPGYVFGAKLSSREATSLDFVPNTLNNPNDRINYETKITYKVPLYTAGKLANAKKVAELKILANIVKYNYDEKTLGLEVLKAYNGAVAAKEFIKAAKKSKKATSSFVDFSTELLHEGLVTSIDVKQAKVHDLGVDAQIIEAKNKYALAIAYLKFLMNDDSFTDVNSFENIIINSLDLRKLKRQAHENREDLKWMKYNTNIIKKKIDIENADLFPTLGAHLEVGNNDDSFNSFDGKHDYYSIAFGLSYTIFDGGISSLEKQNAKIAYYKSKYYLDYKKDSISLEIKRNILTLQSKRKVLLQKIKAHNLSDEVLEQSKEMYKNHLINMNNLLIQQANQQKAYAQTILAKYDETLASATLKISLGEALTTNKENKQ